MKKILLAMAMIVAATSAQADVRDVFEIVKNNVKITDVMVLSDQGSEFTYNFSCEDTFKNRDFKEVSRENDYPFLYHSIAYEVINRPDIRVKESVIDLSFVFFTKGNVLAMCSSGIGKYPLIAIIDKSSYDNTVIEYVKYMKSKEQKEEMKRLEVLDKLDKLLN